MPGMAGETISYEGLPTLETHPKQELKLARLYRGAWSIYGRIMEIQVASFCAFVSKT